MTKFHLQIVTPDGLIYDGEAERLSVRTIDGEVGILANHIDYVTALGMGEARLLLDGKTRRAACIGGMLSVSKGEVKLVATTFEWAENIDKERAEHAYQKAKAALDEKKLSEADLKITEAKLKRALVRKGVAGK
ncbi:MAG: ATP synthase F1 subunit epsilon [Clostridia bacterium]|nr:ATP synthase F1 subunit epsilon [Clostridia bacterium]